MILNSTLGGSSGAIKLAPDLTFPSDKMSDSDVEKQITGIDGSAGYATALSLSGKFIISRLVFTGLIAESVSFRMTVDGVLIWDDTLAVSSSTFSLLKFNGSSATFSADTSFQCDSTMLLEIQTTTDTSVTLDYIARPIL